VAEAVSWLMGNVLPIKADLTGRLCGWYRLATDAGLLPAERRLRALDVEEVLTICYVPNGIVHADITVDGAGAPLRFVSPMGTAVPVASMVDHLAGWLGLPAGDWQLHHDGERVQPHAILADLDTGAPLISLTLRPGTQNPGTQNPSTQRSGASPGGRANGRTPER